MRIEVASTNPGKLRDFAYAAQGLLLFSNPVEIEPLVGIEDIPAPAEIGRTFMANATAKAVYYSKLRAGPLVLADDSGIEVDALDGLPGVRSARFADDHGYALDSSATTDERNNALLISMILKKTFSPRTARYRCGLALARNGVVLGVAEGTVEGRIVTMPRGDRGFGYDPIFLIPEMDQTMGQLEPAVRIGLSHRGRALQALLRQKLEI
ncbi:MAG: non-canonical purine NTP pyrophosphatase [Acidobacteriota bacterium]|nr:non-canonical purine NTP pyrophosphatase [Acidobacteriota bacterium]